MKKLIILISMLFITNPLLTWKEATNKVENCSSIATQEECDNSYEMYSPKPGKTIQHGCKWFRDKCG